MFLIPMIGAAGLFGRVVLTTASDRLGRCNWLAAVHIAMGLGYLLWWFTVNNIRLLTAFSILFGVGYCGYISMNTPTLVEYFRIRKIGGLLGCFVSIKAID